MGMYLIAQVESSVLSTTISIIQVAIGLGLVIFVHELGHFAVAKMCGVKCEKFYLGFDIYGLKLAKFTYGETEYGIGILPLGGYVKMLGQEDNPARVAAELERAKQYHEPGHAQPDDPAAAEQSAQQEALREHHLQEAGVEGFDASGQPIYDPRSYMAKSVPQRMAIISAGVVMNVIFAFMMAAVAFGMGIDGPEYAPCIVGGTSPGSPAWVADLQVDERVVQIGDVENPQFREIRSEVTLGSTSDGVPLVVERADGELETLQLVPDNSGGFPLIGLNGPSTLKIFARAESDVYDGPRIESDPPLEDGDLIVAIEGQQAKTYGDLSRAMALAPDQPLRLTVLRGAEADDATAVVEVSDGQTLDVVVPPRPMRGLGLIMQMGPVMAVQKNSPAEVAGIKAGDTLLEIDGQPVGDPLTLPDRLRRRAGDQVSLRLQRPGVEEDIVLESVSLRPTTQLASVTDSLNRPFAKGEPVALPALGIAYRVLNRIEAVDPEGPAAGEIEAGQYIVGARVVVPEDLDVDPDLRDPFSVEFDDQAEQANFPLLLAVLQLYPPGSTVELKLADAPDGERQVVKKIGSVTVAGWFEPDRINTKPMFGTLEAQSFQEALALGAVETKEALLMVYRFLQQLFGGGISPRMLGGPVTIFNVAKVSADRGITDLLMFLTLLSANLAVINFLPIPVLDGGHMVFLMLEAIRGKPVGERVLVAFQMAGFMFIVGLMVFVLLLDVGLIARFN